MYFFSISVSGSAQSWVEIAFGTKSGIVRVIVQHPENVGQGLQVFRTFVAHTCPVIKIVLGEKHLITGMTCTYICMYIHTHIHTTHTHNTRTQHTHTHTRTQHTHTYTTHIHARTQHMHTHTTHTHTHTCTHAINVIIM